MGQNDDRPAGVLAFPSANLQCEVLARLKLLSVAFVPRQIHFVSCRPGRRYDTVGTGKVQVIGAPSAEIRDTNRGSVLVPIVFVSRWNDHVEPRRHKPRMRTVEVLERHRHHRRHHAARNESTDINSHNTHPIGKRTTNALVHYLNRGRTDNSALARAGGVMTVQLVVDLLQDLAIVVLAIANMRGSGALLDVMPSDGLLLLDPSGDASGNARTGSSALAESEVA